MSLLTSSVATNGSFTNVATNVLNNAFLTNFAGGADGDILTWNELTKSWEPQTPTGGTNVFVSPVVNNAEYYPTFVSHEHGSLPLNTNLDLTYNPGTKILTVPFVDSICTNAVDAVNTDNVSVTENPGTNADLLPTFVTGNMGQHAVQVDSGFTYNPATSTLTVANITGTVSTATDSNKIEITNDTTTNAPFYVTFAPGIAGSQPLKVDSVSLRFNPGTNTLTVPNVAGNASSATDSVNSTNVFVTNNTADNNTYFPTFVAANSGNQGIQVDSNTYTYNPGTNTLTVPNLSGTASNATDAVNSAKVNVMNETASPAPMYPTFVSTNAGNNQVKVDSTNLTYNPGTDTLSSALFSGSLINVVTINGNAYPPPLPSRIPVGNTLTVDAENGNDMFAILNRYGYYFKTISAALALAVAGENVVINAGTYNEKLTIPSGVSLTGAGAQCVVIQQLNVTEDTTLITVGNNCRLENFTAKLTTAASVNLIGIDYLPNGSSITTKLRNSIWTVQNTFVGGTANVYGVYSGATSDTGFTAVNAIQRTTINVLSSTNGIVRGIYVNGPNRFAVRDIVVWARGANDPVVTGTNIIGVETKNAAAYCEIKTSTISGELYDINRTLGSILLGFTDLRNNKANGNSFSVVTESSQTIFGTTGNFGTGTLFLVPGTLTINNLPGVHFDIPTPQNMILFSGTIRFTGTIGMGQSLIFRVYKNDVLTPFTMTLGEGQTTTSLSNVSVDFTAGNTYYATCEVVGGNLGNNVFFTATLAFY